jgi:uncharacterized membrane protein (DUF106 family)
MEKKVFLKFTDEMLKMAEYEPPKLDETKEEIKKYVNSLKKSDVPDKQKHSLLKDYINQKLSLVFNEYKSRYRQNDEIIENINDKIKYDTEELNKLEKKIEEENKNLEYLDSEEIITQKEIKEIQTHENVKPTLYEKFTAVFFIIMALGLAVLSAYEFSISLAKIEALANGKELNDIHIPVIKFILFLFGSFSILIASKAINLLYEKFNYSKKFFITVVSLSVILAISSAVMLSSDKAFITGVYNLKQEIKKVETKKNELSDLKESGEEFTAEDEAQLKKYENKLNELRKKLKEANKKSVELDFLASIIILIAEMFAGATAWMYISEYDLKFNKHSQNSILKNLEETLQNIEKEKQETQEKIENLKNEYIKTKEEIHRLNLILSKIKTEKEIEQILENYKNSIYKEELINLSLKEKE